MVSRIKAQNKKINQSIVNEKLKKQVAGWRQDTTGKSRRQASAGTKKTQKSG
jgi:hypothetical protein